MSSSEETPAESALFSEFCLLLEKLQKSKQRQEQYNIIVKYLNEYRIKCAGNKNSSFFPILRLLLPKEERERGAYNLKETTLKELLIKVLAPGKDDTEKLRRYQSNTQNSDFAGAAYFVLKNRVKSSGTLTIGNINRILDKIANAEVGNKAPVLDEAMSEAIRSLSADQIMWFLRIILKDLKLGIGHQRILAAFHPDAPDLYDNCRNLVKVCEELEDGETRLPEAGIQVFFAVAPMLSERLDVANVDSLPQHQTYYIEAKFDGERFQMHMENGNFEYFSRKGYTWSGTYGSNYDSGLLTPDLKNCFSPSVTSVILDGEMMGWHKYHQCLGSKGMNFDIKKITERSSYRPCFCVFDILYYNGKSLVGPSEKGGLPLNERLKLLDNIFTEIKGVIHHSKRTIVKKSVDILDALNEAIENQEEGIVVKDSASYYLANKRSAGWYKIKPEYTDSAMEDMDLVIIGADEAENKSQGRASSFVVACADRVEPGAPPHRWVSVGRVSSGLSYDERSRLCAQLERNWQRARDRPPPPNLAFNKDKPDFWILPEHSVVLQIRATELIRNSHFAAAYTLRFPRITQLRADKPVGDVMTLDEFNKLVEEKRNVMKLATKRIGEDQILDPNISPRKRLAKTPQVAEQFAVPKGEGAVVTSHALRGRKLCVLSDDEDCKKAELKKIIESHDGVFVANPSPAVWCCVAGKLDNRVKSYVAKQELDIITTSWLRSLPPSAKPCTLSPLDMLSIKKSTKLAMSRQFDSFSDSYTETVDEDTLRKLFRKMDDQEPVIYLTKEEMLELDKELYGDNPPSFLRPFYIHFVAEKCVTSLQARLLGATVCNIDCPKLTHVVVSRQINPDDLEKIRATTKAAIVSEEWLEQCIENEHLVPEDSFLL